MATSSASASTCVIEGVKFGIDILQDVSSALPAPAQILVNLAKRIIVTAEAIKNNRDLCEELQDRLLRLMLVIIMLVKRSAGASTLPLGLRNSIDQLESKLESILEEVKKVEAVVGSRRKRHKLAAFVLSQSHTSALKKCTEDLDWAMKEFDVSSHLASAVHLLEVGRKVQTVLTNQFLESLPRAKYAGFDCERPDRPSSCFEGTRTAILQTIFEWIVNPDRNIPRFFWMMGIAGVGKTTVALTIAELARKEGLLGGQFAFSRKGEAELRNPALVFPTIAYQLARFDPDFCERITAAIQADPEAPYAGLKQQLERLIINPLSGLQRDPKRVVVVIFDAFDECEARGAKEILHLLVSAMPSLPFFLKILVTSRSEPHIRSVLVPSTNLHITALHDIEKSIVKGDIRLYLRARLRALPVDRNINLPLEWVKEHEIEILAEEAGNLFILAETYRRFLSDSLDIRRQLDKLLRVVASPVDASNATNPYAHLDKFYLNILCGMINENNSLEVTEAHQEVLGTIVLLRDPLPVDALEKLIGPESPKVSSVLPLLHSVVLPPSTVDQCPRIYHPSFADFLQDGKRCSDERFRIDLQTHEARMAIRCLELLNTHLHMNILGDLDPSLFNSEVKDLGGKIRDAFPLELQYACRYWASHVVNVGERYDEVARALETFSAKTLLSWLKAMSWLGDTRLCLTSLEGITSWVTKRDCSLLTKSLLNGGHRLLLAHFPTISKGAQHLTRSVLPFVPRNINLLSQYGQDTDPTVTIIRGIDLDWPATLMVLTSHTDCVNSVVFSPDGSRLASGQASGSDDKGIRIWDATSSSCLATLEGHTSCVQSVSFSPDCSYLASGSYDKSVRVWDATTGVCLATLEGHSRWVDSVTFSPDGTRLASGSYDEAVWVWNTATLNCVFVLEGHTHYVRSVAYSSDGTRLASGSEDKTVRVWDAIVGKPLATLEGHSQRVMAVVFAPTEARLASASSDKTIRIWDVATFTCLATLKGHASDVTSVSFTPDGSHLASGSWDKTIRIWDPINATCLTTFHGHSSGVISVAFSLNSSRLASASGDKTIHIWDMSTVSNATGPQNHFENVKSISFSPDGTRLASVSSLPADTSATVQVWNATTGEYLTTLKGQSAGTRSVAFSPGGSQIASGSNDEIVRVWDSMADDCPAILSEHSGWVNSVMFSPDGTRLVSGSRDKTVRVWDPIKGECLAVLEGHSDYVISVAYSPDGSRLASGSRDLSIRVWDASSGTCLATLLGHSRSVESVNFSPNGSFITSKYSTGDRRIWDALTYIRSDKSGEDGTNKAWAAIGDRLEVEAGKLVRIDTSGIIHLICILPPSFDVLTTRFIEDSPGGYRVALGCGHGMVILKVSLS